MIKKLFIVLAFALMLINPSISIAAESPVDVQEIFTSSENIDGEVKISCTSTGDSAAIEMLGLISINAKANAMNKFLIMNLNFYKFI